MVRFSNLAASVAAANGARLRCVDTNYRGKALSELVPEDGDLPAKASTETAEDDAVDKRNKLLVEIWKQAVETQKHFNDMCVKSRQLGLTFVAASLGAALYLFIRPPPAARERQPRRHRIRFQPSRFPSVDILSFCTSPWLSLELRLRPLPQ